MEIIKAKIKKTGEICNIKQLILNNTISDCPIRIDIGDVELISEKQTVSIEDYNELKKIQEYEHTVCMQTLASLKSAHELIKQLKYNE